MRAMSLATLSSLEKNPEPLRLVDVPMPVPQDDEILVRVATCGVCHTELDEIEGRAPPPLLPVIPGHEVVGRVEKLGPGASRYQLGDRVGIGWIYRSSGAENENLSRRFQATGRDVDGGYAEFLTVSQDYAYLIPDVFSDAEAAPLLCAGSVGYRALRLANIESGERLGLTGFGGSGHLVLQLSRYLYPDTDVYVFARSAKERDFAMELGAIWSGDTSDAPPKLLHAVIDTTPAWLPVLAALKALLPGGRLVINAIRKESRDRHLLQNLDYAEHLWMEKELKTVANVTRHDIAEFLTVAAKIPLKPVVRTFALEDANLALRELKSGHIRGSYVLKP